IFGGSGVRESDPEWAAKVPKDKEGRDPQESEASAKFNARQTEARAALDTPAQGGAAGAAAAEPARAPRRARGQAAEGAAAAAPPAAAPAGPAIDLAKITFPVMAINGEFDSPNGKTHRLWRELPNFTNLVLPGKSHLTSVYPGYCPPLYVESITKFINTHD